MLSATPRIARNHLEQVSFTVSFCVCVGGKGVGQAYEGKKAYEGLCPGRVEQCQSTQVWKNGRAPTHQFRGYGPAPVLAHGAVSRGDGGGTSFLVSRDYPWKDLEVWDNIGRMVGKSGKEDILAQGGGRPLFTPPHSVDATFPHSGTHGVRWRELSQDSEDLLPSLQLLHLGGGRGGETTPRSMRVVHEPSSASKVLKTIQGGRCWRG
eukprot:74355-Chlamydomonas_euryale.AAC.2